MIKFNLELDWKEFNVNLEMVQEHVKSLDSNICGTSANSKLVIHFLEIPEPSVHQQILDYWNDLDEESEEVESYLSKEQIQADKLAKKASGIAKLVAAGLITQAEADAMVE